MEDKSNLAVCFLELPQTFIEELFSKNILEIKKIDLIYSKEITPILRFKNIPITPQISETRLTFLQHPKPGQVPRKHP